MRSVRESPEPSYRDIKVSIRFPNGGVGEIIVASKFYDDVKFNCGGHEAYEVIRTIEAKWPNEDDIPRELKDVCADFRLFSEMIYSRGSSLEDIRMAYSSASASRTRLPSSNSLFGRQKLRRDRDPIVDQSKEGRETSRTHEAGGRRAPEV